MFQYRWWYINYNLILQKNVTILFYVFYLVLNVMLICALCSKYNIRCLSVTEYRIKEQLWSHFMDNL